MCGDQRGAVAFRSESSYGSSCKTARIPNPLLPLPACKPPSLVARQGPSRHVKRSSAKASVERMRLWLDSDSKPWEVHQATDYWQEIDEANPVEEAGRLNSSKRQTKVSKPAVPPHENIGRTAKTLYSYFKPTSSAAALHKGRQCQCFIKVEEHNLHGPSHSCAALA